MSHIKNYMISAILFFIFSVPLVVGQKQDSKMSFTISMDNPNTHYYQVVFLCEGIQAEGLNFKMPAWTPGYYWILDCAKNVLNFRAEDGSGNPLSWGKTAKNIWHVNTGSSDAVTIKYNLVANRISVAESFLDDGRGFISPTGVFMHVEEMIEHPVTVEINPYHEWSTISTGLDPIENQTNTFFAPNFDVLYDCPILVGNQEILSFKFREIPHTIAIEDLGNFDRDKFIGDFKQIVETSTNIIGDIPYNHYTFIIMNRGMGGLEHRNSMAVFYNPGSMNNPGSYMRWLAFITHEYFHLYNVKTIRPIALGPFDYDRENYTNMLWVSEGITVYFEDLILNRAGFQTRDESLEQIRRNIMRHENIPGHLFQSATEASFDTWIHFFNRDPDKSNRTISYYDKGSTLGLLLDLKIRHETKNRKSLDDVMRTLYYEFYKEKKRGFTDKEFRDVCESISGCSLEEIFDDYAATVKEINYPEYFAYCGLHINTEPSELPGAYLGTTMREQNGKLTISSVEWNSPAWNAGLSTGDEVISVNGSQMSNQEIKELLRSKKAGDKVKFVITHRDMKREYEVVLGKKMEPDFQIEPMTDPDPLQLTILNDWLKEY